jgi:hypothetical protein
MACQREVCGVRRTCESAWDGFAAAHLRRLQHVLFDVARELARHAPAPRGLPFFGLDHPAGEPSPLGQLAAHGIFRKYESVLMLGAGLGGAARWCHAHFGCDVTGVEPSAPVAAAAEALTRRAGLARTTRFVATSPTKLSFRPGSFTHVWAIDVLGDPVPEDERVGELFEAVRLGGLVGVQCSGASSSWFEQIASSLRHAGFVEVEQKMVSRPPLRESTRRARERLLQALRASDDVEGRAAATALEQVYAGWSIEGGEVAQVSARRPS